MPSLSPSTSPLSDGLLVSRFRCVVFCGDVITGNTSVNGRTYAYDSVGPELVYRWRYPENLDRWTLTTCSPLTRFDTELYLFSSTTFEKEHEVFWNDDCISCQSVVDGGVYDSPTHMSVIYSPNNTVISDTRKRDDGSANKIAFTVDLPFVPGEDVWVVVAGHDPEDVGFFELHVLCQGTLLLLDLARIVFWPEIELPFPRSSVRTRVQSHSTIPSEFPC